MSHSVECDLENDQDEFVGLTKRDASGDLNELFGSSMPRLLKVADCVLHNYHDSEDALQDGLLSALRHLDQFRGNSQFSTWLYSIVRNSALAKRRRQRVHPTFPIDDPDPEDENGRGTFEPPVDPGPDPERMCAQSELLYLFYSTLSDLPENYRAIVRLCDLEGFSGKEAAERLGLTVSALKAQHHRARQAIREGLSSEVLKRCG